MRRWAGDYDYNFFTMGRQFPDTVHHSYLKRGYNLKTIFELQQFKAEINMLILYCIIRPEDCVVVLRQGH